MKKETTLVTRRCLCCLALLIGGWMLLMTACEPSATREAPDGEDTTAPIPLPLTRVNVQISSRSAAAAVPTREDYLHTVRVYAFQPFQGFMKLVGYAYRESANEDTPLDLEASSDAIRFTLPNANTTFVVLANEKAAVDANHTLKIHHQADFDIAHLGPTTPGLTWSTTSDGVLAPGLAEIQKNLSLETLRQLTFSKMPKTTTADGKEILPLLPMGRIAERPTSVPQVNLQLLRAVAKLDLYFAKIGRNTDRLFMGRGIYLYNQPPFGYLLPQKNNPQLDFGQTPFEYLETEPTHPKAEEETTPQQLGGRELLKATDQLGVHSPQGVDINEITSFNNTPEQGGASDDLFQQMPTQSFYLFANLMEAQIVNHQKPNPATNEYKQGGYYLKILSHAHGIGSSGKEEPLPGKTFYVPLKKVIANQHIRVKSRIVMKGYLELLPHWVITDWTEHDINVPEFN